MIKLTKKELVNITNEACGLLYHAGPNDVLAFKEEGGSVKPVLLPENPDRWKIRPVSAR